MVIAILFAHCWGVIQLFVLASGRRTVRLSTVALALATGLFTCAPLAVALSLAWASPLAWAIGRDAAELVRVGAYTLDPFLEELIKLLPLLALTQLAVVRRQWSLTDCILLGGAIGAGFALAEDLYRFGALAPNAVVVRGGWVLPAMGYAFVPDAATSMASWLPDPGMPRMAFGQRLPGIDLHLIWSTLGGLAVGLLALRREFWARPAALVIFLYIGGDHAGFNADIAYGPLLITAPFRLLRDLLPVLPVMALGIAFRLDASRQRIGEGAPLLPAERTASPRVLGTFTEAFGALPQSLFDVARFVQLRRVYAAERAWGDGDPGLIARQLDVLAARIESGRQQVRSASLGLAAAPSWLLRSIRSPAFVAWIALTLSALLWFAGVRGSGSISVVFLVLSLGAQLWLLWRIFSATRAWRRMRPIAIADSVAGFVFRLTAAGGVLAFGGYALFKLIDLPSAGDSLSGHAAEAFELMPPEQELPMAQAGAATLAFGEPFAGALAAGGTAAEAEGAAVLAAGGAGGSMAATAVAAGVPVAAGILGAAAAVDHAAHLAESVDPDVVSPPGGVPEPLAERGSKSPTRIPNPPTYRPPSGQDTIYAPDVGAPTIPAQPWTSPSTDPRNPLIPPPPRIPREFEMPSEPADPPEDAPQSESEGPETTKPTE